MESKFDKLSDIAEVIDSLHKTPKYSDEGQAMVRCTDVRYGKLDLTNTFKVNEEIFAEFSRRYTPTREDIIITRVGSYGITAIVDELDFCLGQNTSVIIPKGINPRYLYLALNSPYVKNQIEFSVVGSTQKTLSLKAINNLDIPRFDPVIESKIAKTGGELDDKIELNRQINQTLEDIAQAIFKSWFVDFDLTRAKITAKEKGQNPELAAMAVIAGKEVEELEALSADQLEKLKSTAALFPDGFEDSELGEIPEGWEKKPLSKMVSLIGGGTPKKSEDLYWNGDIPWFSVKDAPADGDVFVVDTIEKITELGLSKSSTKLLSEGVTIISARGTVGKLAIVGKPTAMNQSCYGVEGANGIGAYLNYFNLKEAISTLQQNTHGAVFDTITRDTFGMVFLVDAPSEIQSIFEGFTVPLFKKIKSNLLEKKSLEHLRDTLLPKLLSGELNISSNKKAIA